MRPLRPRFAAGLLLAPLLTGCFSSGGSSASGGSTASDGGRLRVALAFPPTQNLSPHGQDAFSLARLGISEGLTRLDANGTAAPALAESWSAEKGGLSWLFTLRDAKFQDGTEVTPAAVAAALTRVTQAKPVPAALSGVKLTAQPAGEGRVRVTTAVPDPVLPQRLSNPTLAVFSPKAYGKGAVSPIGTATGPFELTRVTGATQATLNRFDDYWGGRAQASGIDVTWTADSTARANALRTGAADIAEAIPVSQAGSLDKGTVRETPTGRTVSLSLNSSSGAFADPGLRAAAREAIDTSVLAKNVYEGKADAGQGLFGPALTWAPGKRVTPAGRAKATAPKSAAITLATYDSRPELAEAAQVLQQQLQKAGFKVKLEVREYSRIESDALGGKFDAFIGSRNTMLDTGDPVSVLTSDFTCDGPYNLAQLCDKAVDRAVARAAGITDTAERRDAAMAAEAAILATGAVVPLVHEQAVTGVAASVRGVLLDPYERAFVGTGTRR
ncbi:ABC transporter substrate-binding protein [Streptomyces sp. NPDC052236]|uniref:ABC transporter substrate-binding protein n=1 Tax=Streptomyces sp. NPDC052236 TaxID=3365686 RepID=UPI0037D55D35